MNMDEVKPGTLGTLDVTRSHIVLDGKDQCFISYSLNVYKDRIDAESIFNDTLLIYIAMTDDVVKFMGSKNFSDKMKREIKNIEKHIKESYGSVSIHLLLRLSDGKIFFDDHSLFKYRGVTFKKVGK